MLQVGEFSDVDSLATGYLNKARALLESGTQVETTRRVVLVWRLLLWVTKTIEERSPTLAVKEAYKNVFYRAAEQCPGAKVLYLVRLHCTLVLHPGGTLLMSRD